MIATTSGSERRYRLVVFSRCLPYEGIDHAGGEYVHRAVAALSNHADITVVVVDAPRERLVATRTDLPYRPLVIDWYGIYRHPAFVFLRRVQNKLVPLSLPIGLRRSMAVSEELATVCGNADIIEIQWTEMLPAWRNMARNLERKRTVVVAHDVVSQRYERLAQSSQGFISLWNWIQWANIRSRERRLLQAADVVVTFSEKDAKLLRQLGVSNRVQVLIPPLDTPAMESGRHPHPSMALFVGNFQRRENIDAADWLLREIWPSVRRMVPSAHLVLAGSWSDEYLKSIPHKLRAGVEATGYVSSLDTYYRNAGVALIPIRLGAGVKFKTLTAMLWGIPIVSTPEGVEGLAHDDCYVGVTSNAPKFAALVAYAMRTPSAGAAATRAQAWARAHTIGGGYTSTLLDIHEMRHK